MAIRDITKKPYIADRDENVFIGIDLPFRKSDTGEGWFTSTTTTIDAVKNNIRNLLLTNKGERFLQPNLGLNLRQYLFEQYTPEMVDMIKVEISDTIRIWLPFVEIKQIEVDMDDEDAIGKNTMNIFVLFNIKNNPNILDSISIEITGE